MYLRTLGGLSIAVEPGSGEAPSPGPRRLALLALVAAAGARGITREKIIGILWSEREEDQARHSLAQTLYLLRRETGAAWITGTAILKLEPPDSSDVGRFQQALDSGDLERAVEVYTGPFLEGFYLSGTPEFEEWVEDTRARLQRAALKALELLTRRAAEGGSHAEAANWWRRLVEMDPLSATYAAGRIRALVAAGDPAAGLRAGREYQSRVRRELEIEPDAAIARLMEEVRASLAANPAEPAQSDEGPGRRTSEPPGMRAHEAKAAGAREDAAPGSAAPRRVGPGFRLVAALAAGLALAIAGWRVGFASRAVSEPPLLAIGSIQPRNVPGAGSVLRDMLATNISRVGGLRVLANSRLVELLARADTATPVATAEAARRAGATELVEGELEEIDGGFVLTLRRVALSSGVVLQGYTVRASDLYAITDSATAAIATDFGLDPPPDAVAAVRTGSAIAYALYEQGLRAFFGGDAPAAIRLMSAALDRDSAFAMAAAYLWRSNWEAQRYDEAARLRPLVQRIAARAADRERLWIEGMLAWAGAPLPDLLRIAQELALRFPEHPDAQMLLGRALNSAGDWAGSVAAFDRAVAIDSVSGAVSATFCRVCRSIIEMSTVWMWRDSLAAAERTMRRLIAFRPEEETGWTGLVETLLRQGRRAEAEAAIAQARRLTPRSIDFGSLLDRDLIRSGRLEELEARLVSALRTAAPQAPAEMTWLLALTLRNQGRLREARDLAGRGAVPGSPARLESHQDLVTLAIVALERGLARESARRFLDMVEGDRSSQEQPGFKARNLSWHMTLAGTALSAAGDTAVVRALADSVERIGQGSSFGRDLRLHHFLRGLLLKHESRHAEAVEAFRRSLFSLTDGYTRINLEMAGSLVALGRPSEAIAILQPALRGGVDGGNTYVTHTELHEALARAFEVSGQADSASVHWTAVERAWRKADPEFDERYRHARDRVNPRRSTI